MPLLCVFLIQTDPTIKMQEHMYIRTNLFSVQQATGLVGKTVILTEMKQLKQKFIFIAIPVHLVKL